MKFTGTFVSTIGNSDCYDIESCVFMSVTVEAESTEQAIDKLNTIKDNKLFGLYEWRNWKLWDLEENIK